MGEVFDFPKGISGFQKIKKIQMGIWGRGLDFACLIGIISIVNSIFLSFICMASNAIEIKCNIF